MAAVPDHYRKRFFHMAARLERLERHAPHAGKVFADLARRLKSVDPRALFLDLTVSADPAAHKYIDLPKHVARHHERVARLELVDQRGLHVLDLGGGAGFFSYIARLYGHQAIGLDCKEGYVPFYRFFDTPLSLQGIHPQQPLVRDAALDGHSFDLITGFSICFNVREHGSLWTADDYLFLLNDLRCRFLAPGGRLSLLFHAAVDGADGAADNAYYRALAQLLDPFVARRRSRAWIDLDLSQGAAWSAAAGVRLPKSLGSRRSRRQRRRAE